MLFRWTDAINEQQDSRYGVLHIPFRYTGFDHH